MFGSPMHPIRFSITTCSSEPVHLPARRGFYTYIAHIGCRSTIPPSFKIFYSYLQYSLGKLPSFKHLKTSHTWHSLSDQKRQRGPRNGLHNNWTCIFFFYILITRFFLGLISFFSFEPNMWVSIFLPGILRHFIFQLSFLFNYLI